ncbi:MAG: hypothetical protein R3F61_24770 [Myxococcota bacterium]
MRPLVDLLLLAALLGAFWRAEVEWHGWHGLIWVQYFHWVVPVGVLAFLAWLGQTPIVVHTGRRWGLLGLAAVHAVVTVVLVHTFLFGIFQRFSLFRLQWLVALCTLGLVAPPSRGGWAGCWGTRCGCGRSPFPRPRCWGRRSSPCSRST